MADKILTGTKEGLAPGTLLYEGDTEPIASSIKYIRITKGAATTELPLEGVFPSPDNSSLLWVRVSGLADIELISALGKFYGIDHLILEDILETTQRPKYESLNSYLFVIIKQLSNGTDKAKTIVDQLSIIMGVNFVVTFEETTSKNIDILERRVSTHPESFFERGAGYLAYATLDISVDCYLAILDDIETEIEDLEDEILSSIEPANTDRLFDLKRRVNILHRNTRPTYEIVGKLMRSSPEDAVSMKKSTVKYLRDLADQTVRLRDSIQACKDSINAIYDENMSRIQLKTNRVINILTSFSVLLMPSMIISGIYGMNFSFLPGLSSEYGFFIALGIMTFISASLFFFFRRKKFI